MKELLRQERAQLLERTRESERMFERARGPLVAGVASSYQRLDPWPVYLTHGEGARVWDVDGNEYLDFHNGFSAMVQGHAHPAITAAVTARQPLGTHFGLPTEEAVEVAEELARRFGLPRWRFTNSGTESVMDAIRIARAHAGRDDVVKIAGAYHGHADTTMVSVGPEPGYLEAVRDAARATGTVLIFDEVKTGLTIAAGGAVERFGVRPDMVTLAKALGAGLPTGAIGMTDELAALVEDGSVRHVGTYNGNPLGMAAARANLLEVLTPEAYGHLERLGERMAEGVGAGAMALGSKGCVHRESRDPERSRLIWTWLMNRGILTTPGREQEWNVTVAHDDAAVDRYVETFAELTERWSATARA